MINKLRRKFIAIAMLSLFAVLAIIMITAGILNYRSVIRQADQTLQMLRMGEGQFPGRDNTFEGTPPMGPLRPQHPNMSPELPFESRFFSVVLAEDGTPLSSDTAHIAAIDGQSAATMAQQVWRSGDTRGFIRHYRYTVTAEEKGSRIIFLDCTRSLSAFYSFLWTSLLICGIGLAAVFILMLLLSRRIVRPLSESYEKQKQFITDAGHEIKTPITIIDADAEVLEMELGDNEWLRDIRKQTERLATLTEDLIYLSRMEEPSRLQCIDFPLSDMVGDTAASFVTLAKSKEKELKTEIETALSCRGDEKALRQLVSLLLDNAVKYAPVHSVIHLKLQRQGKNILLQTANATATPLPPEELSHLFQRFYRSDKSRSLQKGHGIGLSVAAAIVTAHKGKITATQKEQTLLITAIFPQQ